MGVGILKVVVLRSEGVERVKIVNIMVMEVRYDVVE